jgi:hypothetical protein
MPISPRPHTSAAPPPGELTRALARNSDARAQWDKSPPSHKRQTIEWIGEAKRAETRDKRIAQTVERLATGGQNAMLSAAPLAKKLGVRPGMRVVVLDAPDGYAANIAGAATRGKGDVVLAFARDTRHLGRVAPKALDAMGDGDALWVAYPKKTSGIPTDISRDAGWDAMKRAGWQGVALVAIDDKWSAMRFRRI